MTSRPLLLHGMGKLTRHAGQTKETITSIRGQEKKSWKILLAAGRFFQTLDAIAELLTQEERWRWLLSAIFRNFLGGRLLRTSLMMDFSG